MLTNHNSDTEAQIYSALGYQCLIGGYVPFAMDSFLRALSHAPENAIVLTNLGNALFQLKRYDEARAVYEQAIAAKPDYPKPYRNLALLFQMQGKNEEAIAAYQQYLSGAPDDGEAHHNLGLVLMAVGRTNEAQATFESVAEYLSTDDVESTTNLGVGYFFRGDLERALELFREALADDPAYVTARYYLGLTYLHRGRCSEAIAELESVVVAAPDFPHARSNLAVAYLTARQPERAITILLTLVEQQPRNPSLLLNLGYAYADAGLKMQAAACYRQAISLTAPNSRLEHKARVAVGELVA